MLPDITLCATMRFSVVTAHRQLLLNRGRGLVLLVLLVHCGCEEFLMYMYAYGATERESTGLDVIALKP